MTQWTIQSPLNRRWNTTGKIISVLPERQYKISVDGSGRITFRDRSFLKKCNITAAATPIPSATPVPITLINNTPRGYSNSQTPSIYNMPAKIEPPRDTTYTSTRPRSSKIPRALSRLFPHNRPGLKELHDIINPCPYTVEGEGRCRSQWNNNNSNLPEVQFMQT